MVIPTRNRPEYLRTTLQSIAEQELDEASLEVVVVDDGSGSQSVELVVESCLERAVSWKYVRPSEQRGLNAARNAGIAASSGDPIVFADDDIEAPRAWIQAFLRAVQAYPEYDVYGGPIRARLEGSNLRFCGRENPPISTLDLGDEDLDVERVWGGNMAVRREIFERIGPFDADHRTYGGDEELWEQKLLDSGGKIKYVAAAWYWHRRSPQDSRLSVLCKAAFGQGRGLRAYDRQVGKAPPLRRELRVFTGCLWHGGRYRCSSGPIMACHSAGRIVGALKGR